MIEEYRILPFEEVPTICVMSLPHSVKSWTDDERVYIGNDYSNIKAGVLYGFNGIRFFLASTGELWTSRTIISSGMKGNITDEMWDLFVKLSHEGFCFDEIFPMVQL